MATSLPLSCKKLCKTAAWYSLKRATGKQDSHFKIVEPKTGREFQGNWAFAEKTIQSMIDAGLILFPSSSDGVPRQKKFINSYLNETKAAVTSLRWHSTEASTKDSMALFDGKKIFDFPKPLSLLDYLCKQASVDNDIILDFFAGSGTTAHAVMQLNAEDGGNRQFICVQIDEATDPKSEAYKAGYHSIFDITQARISKAAAKIKDTLPTDVVGRVLTRHVGLKPDLLQARELDLGFKVFASQPMFDKYLDTPESLTENLELFDVKTLSQADRHSLMLTWALRDGIKLGAPLQPVTLGGYTKIPKNSIRIPLVGGFTYSPDFAYVVKGVDGKSALNLVVEAKDKTELGLGGDEAKKIKHAERYFNQLGGDISVSFKKQLHNKKIVELIKEVTS